MNSQPVVFLLGPTASGKTGASIALAKSLDAEIISVDSALVYRGMDIGTAKPDMQERDGIAHHVIDVCTPDVAYSVARFCEDAMLAIEDVRGRGKRALLTGGTMLYFSALEKGIAPLPEADATLRDALSSDAQRLGWPKMHERLTNIDPVAASRIHPNDPQRIQRALEVYELTGKPLSDLQKNTQPLLDMPPLKFALVPDSRAWLHERIERRFVQMLSAGFLDELKHLRESYTLHAALPAMRSVGYRQAWEHLVGDTDFETMIDKAQAATRQLAKRQITWIRGMENLNKISCDQFDEHQQLTQMLDIIAKKTSV